MQTSAHFPGHSPEAPLDLGDLAPVEVESIVGRLADGSMPALADTLARVGNCAHPVRLIGGSDTVDARTGEIIETFHSSSLPLGMLFKPCGNRRDEVCPSCSRTYARDTFELISTGVHGGKGVPADVKWNPLLFITLTAPSFGAVHSVRNGSEPCRPRSKTGHCTHGLPLTCWAKHSPGDKAVGAPLCRDCYDVESAAVWQWHAPELWRRFTIALRRRLAAALDVCERDLRKHARLEYAKVAEFQARGLVHFHGLVRIDGPDGPGSQSPIDGSRLVDLIRKAACTVRCTAPSVDGDDVERTLAFGAQTDVRVVRERGVVGDEITSEQVAGYLAKYSTKSSGVDPRRPLPHLARMVETCIDLARRALAACPFGCADRVGQRHPKLCGDCEDNPYARLGRWASMLGFRGHFSTKSRRYSVTLGALRRRRRRFQRLASDRLRNAERLDTRAVELQLLDDEEETTLVVGSWVYQGTGWPREGDRALAAASAARAREWATWRTEHRTRRPA